MFYSAILQIIHEFSIIGLIGLLVYCCYDFHTKIQNLQTQTQQLQLQHAHYAKLLKKRNTKWEEWQEDISATMDGVAGVLQNYQLLDARIKQLEKGNLEENLDIADANIHKIRDVLDETRNQLLALENGIYQNNTKFQTEMHELIACIQHRVDKLYVRGIPDRQLSPETVFNEYGHEVTYTNYNVLPQSCDDSETDDEVSAVLMEQ